MNIIYIHLILMSLVFLLSFVAGIIAKFSRKKIWWLKAHKTLNQIKAILAIAGFVIAIIMVQSFGLKHFSTVHGIIGLIVFLFIIVQSLIGAIVSSPALIKNKNTKEKSTFKTLKLIHKNIGFFIIVLILVNIIVGLLNLF